MRQLQLDRLSPFAGLCACLLLSAAAGSGDATALIQSSVEGHAKVLTRKNASQMVVPDPATAELHAIDAEVSGAGAPASAVAPPLQVRQILKRKRLSDEKRAQRELEQRKREQQQKWQARKLREQGTPEERERAERERAMAQEEEARAKASAQAVEAKEAEEKQKERESKIVKAQRLASYERQQRTKASGEEKRQMDARKREKDYQWQQAMKQKQKERRAVEERIQKDKALALSRGEQWDEQAVSLHLRGPRPHPPLLLKVYRTSEMRSVCFKIAQHFGIDPRKVVLKLDGRQINTGDGPLKKFGLTDGDALDVEAAP